MDNTEFLKILKVFYPKWKGFDVLKLSDYSILLCICNGSLINICEVNFEYFDEYIHKHKIQYALDYNTTSSFSIIESTHFVWTFVNSNTLLLRLKPKKS